MSNDFDFLADAAERAQQKETETAAESPKPQAKKKRGRPATGKRSDEGWINRAFYVEESTDIDLEAEINRLRREGVKMDKSELVNSCLIAWLKWRRGENPSKCLSEISSRRKSE